MSYVIRAVLSSPKGTEHGQLAIPFPIPREDYDHIIELLETIGIGDTLMRDCHIDEIDSHYGVLKRLEGAAVNVDELDYLAKRLDSFCVGEDAQFQAMAEKLGLTDIKDFINLTFCCQQATVITDFSNLEQIGKNHYMNLNGGGAGTDELEKLDGKEIARLLIESGAGAVTPYGVVYDNGMELERLYDGRHFPAYLYDPPVLALEAVNDDGKMTGLICLPMSERQLERTLLRAEAWRPDVHLKVDINELPESVSDALGLDRLTLEALPHINALCQTVEFFNAYGMDKLSAAASFAKPMDVDQLIRLAENIDLFDFVPNIRTPEEYGRYMIQESGHFEYDENLDGFYNYAGYGKQLVQSQGGQFNDCGYVAYSGAVPLEELMQSPQAPQMGGLSWK